MGILLGADVDELDRLSAQFKAAGDAIAAKGKRITGMVNRTTWKGRDATAFREGWNSDIASQIERASQFLLDAATELTKQAAEQRRASEAYGGGAGAGGGGGGGGAWGSGEGGGGSNWGEGSGGGGGGGHWGGWGDILAPGLSESEEFYKGAGESYGLDIVDYSIWQHGFLGDAGSVNLGNISGGVGIDLDGGHQLIGAFGEFSAASADAEWNLLGNDQWGVDFGGGVSALEAEGMLGYKDGTYGTKFGASLVSAETHLGGNIAGLDLGATIEGGIKFDIGATISSKELQVDLGPVSLGFNVGW